MKHACKWHGHAQVLARLEREPDVLKCQRRRKAHRRRRVGDDQLAEHVEHGRIEIAVGQELQELTFVDFAFAGKGDRFAQGLDHRRSHEVGRELDQIGRASSLAEAGGALAERVEQWPDLFDRVRVPGNDDEQFARSRCVGTAEDRRGDIALTGVVMRLGQAVGQRDADRARRNVDRAFGQAGDNSVRREGDILDRRVVRQHSEYNVALAGIGDGRRDLGALRRQLIDFAGRAVVDGELMPRAEQPPGHAAAHVPKADKSDPHWKPPVAFITVRGRGPLRDN